MKVNDLFYLYHGNGFELLNMKEKETSMVNFVSRTSQNNGVVAQVEEIDIKPFDSGLITVALGGSVLSAFVQKNKFYTAFHMMVLKPKQEMTLEQKLFYCTAIQKNAYRYGYGRQANKTLKSIELPSLDECNKIIGNKIITPIATNIGKSIQSLNIREWKEFKYKEIFRIETCKCSNATELLSDGNDVFYIGAKKNDNGIMQKVAMEENLVSKGNGIIFICDGQGSVGYSNYASNNFIGSTTLSVGYNHNINKYNAMFLVTVLDIERFKFSFGRKRKSNLANSIIKLPVTVEGNPDWIYMENYIKNLPYADVI